MPCARDDGSLGRYGNKETVHNTLDNQTQAFPNKQRRIVPDRKIMQTPDGSQFMLAQKLLCAVQERGIAISIQKKICYLLFDVLYSELLQGKQIRVKGLGTFVVKKSGAPLNSKSDGKLSNKLEQTEKQLELSIFTPAFTLDKALKECFMLIIKDTVKEKRLTAFKAEIEKIDISLPQQLMHAIIRRSGVHISLINRVVPLLFQSIISDLFDDKMVRICGFGVFAPHKKYSHFKQALVSDETIELSPKLMLPRFLPEQSLINAISDAMRARATEANKLNKKASSRLRSIFLRKT